MSPKVFALLLALLGGAILAAGAIRSGGTVLVEIPRAPITTAALAMSGSWEPEGRPIRVILPSPYEAR